MEGLRSITSRAARFHLVKNFRTGTISGESVECRFFGVLIRSRLDACCLWHVGSQPLDFPVGCSVDRDRLKLFLRMQTPRNCATRPGGTWGGPATASVLPPHAARLSWRKPGKSHRLSNQRLAEENGEKPRLLGNRKGHSRRVRKAATRCGYGYGGRARRCLLRRFSTATAASQRGERQHQNAEANYRNLRRTFILSSAPCPNYPHDSRSAQSPQRK